MLIKELFVQVLHKLISFFITHVFGNDLSIVLSVFIYAVINNLLSATDLSKTLLLLLFLVLIYLTFQFIFDCKVLKRKFNAHEGAKIGEERNYIISMVVGRNSTHYHCTVIKILIAHVLLRLQLDFAVFKPHVAELFFNCLNLLGGAKLDPSKGRSLII